MEREAGAKAFPPAPCEWAGMSCFVKVLSSKQFNPAARSLMETPRPRVERYFRWGGPSPLDLPSCLCSLPFEMKSASRAGDRSSPVGRGRAGRMTPPAVSSGASIHRAKLLKGTETDPLPHVPPPCGCGSEVASFRFRKLSVSPGWLSGEAIPLWSAGRALGSENNLKGSLKGEPCYAGPGGKRRDQEKKVRPSAVNQARRPDPCVTSDRSLDLSGPIPSSAKRTGRCLKIGN